MSGSEAAGDDTQEDTREDTREDAGSAYVQGFRIDDPSMDELREVLEAAVDYRGDVTLCSRSGEEVVGYIFSQEASAPDPYVELLARNDASPRSFLYRDIESIQFSGRDTASGKSFETWAKNYEAKRVARARGEDVGPIGIEAESLDIDD